jgi:hypothetical protein
MQKACEQPSQLTAAGCLQPPLFAHGFRVEDEAMKMVI